MPDEISGKARTAESQTWNRLLNQRCDVARTSSVNIRGNCEDELKRRLLIARDIPERVRKVFCRIRCDEPSNAILPKLKPFLYRHTTKGNVRMHESEAAITCLIFLSRLDTPIDST